MAFRSHQEIQRLQALRRLQSTDAAVRGLPPGYIEGYQLSIVDNAPQLSPGIVNVAGSIIERNNSIRISVNEWEALKISGFHYYLYMKREGDITVNPLAPTYNTAYRAKYHPTQPWRYLGLFFVSSAGRIIYKLGWSYEQTRELIVAPEGYPLYADYLCDGTNDEVQFQDASDYLDQAFGGGSIIAKQAKGLTNDAYQFETDTFRLWSNIALLGEQAVIEHSTTTAMEMGDYTDNTGYSNISIKGITLKNLSQQTYAVLMADITNAVIENCHFEGNWSNQCLLSWSTGNAACDRIYIRDCYFKSSPGTGVTFWTGVSGYETCIVTGCTFEQCETGILLGGSYNFIAYNNVVRELISTGGSSYGIILRGKGQVYSNTLLGHLYALDSALDTSYAGIYLEWAVSGDEYGRVHNNYIEGFEGPGIHIHASYENVYLWNNVTRRNGNLLTNGDCENTTGPSLFAEGHNIADGTFSRVTTSPYVGTYCAQINKDTAASSGDCTYEFHDTGSDLHGLQDEITYTLKSMIYIVGDGNGSADKVLSSEVDVEIGDYVASWSYTQASIAATYDAWQEIEVSRQIRASSTNLVARLVIDSAADQDSQVRLDNCRLYCGKVTNVHENCLDDDSGTNVYQIANNWQDPEES